MQVAKLTGSTVNTVISDEWINSLVNDCCHHQSTANQSRNVSDYFLNLFDNVLDRILWNERSCPLLWLCTKFEKVL